MALLCLPRSAQEFADISVGDPWCKPMSAVAIFNFCQNWEKSDLREAIDAGFVSVERLDDEKYRHHSRAYLKRAYARRPIVSAGIALRRFNSLCLQQAWSEKYGLLPATRYFKRQSACCGRALFGGTIIASVLSIINVM